MVYILNLLLGFVLFKREIHKCALLSDNTHGDKAHSFWGRGVTWATGAWLPCPAAHRPASPSPWPATPLLPHSSFFARPMRHLAFKWAALWAHCLCYVKIPPTLSLSRSLSLYASFAKTFW